MEIIKGTTSTGFEYEVDSRKYDDWRLIRAIRDLNKSDDKASSIDYVFSIAELLLGDLLPALEEHVAKQNEGFIPAVAMEKEISDIMRKTNVLKKS